MWGCVHYRKRHPKYSLEMHSNQWCVYYIYNYDVVTKADSVVLTGSFVNSVDCKKLFLSATPVINTPVELAILFNMLRSKEVFPTKQTEFEKF